MDKCKALLIYKKSTKTYEIQFKKDGGVVDITGWTIYFTAKESMEDLDTSAKIKKTVTTFANAEGGIALIELTTTDTDITAGNYWYRIDYRDSDDNEDTLLTGKIKIIEPVLKTRS